MNHDCIFISNPKSKQCRRKLFYVNNYFYFKFYAYLHTILMHYIRFLDLHLDHLLNNFEKNTSHKLRYYFTHIYICSLMKFIYNLNIKLIF